MKKAATLSLALLTVTLLAGFRPYPDAKSVCPKCPQRGDVVRLYGGEDLGGKIVAITDRFYVLKRFGVTRAIPKNKVSTVKWEAGNPTTGLDRVDVVVLKNGLTFAGKIVLSNGCHYLQVQTGKHIHSLWFKLIDYVYKNGAQSTFKVFVFKGNKGKCVSPKDR